MQNSLLKIVLILFVCLILPQQSFAVEDSVISPGTSYSDVIQSAQSQIGQTTTNEEETLAHQAVTGTLENSTIQETNQSELTPIKREIKKQTKPKRGYINTILKFILAMVWVGISSVIIFIILLSYKKLILKGRPAIPTYESTEKTLDTPKNFKEAIKLFLDKTK